jgi:predicted O-methyltransferase YrrM
LHREAAAQDPAAKQRVLTREAELGRRLSTPEKYELYGDAPLAITREVGELLYVLTLSRRPARAVEFGASLGVSTIYLAAAIRDCGEGSLLSTEAMPGKARRASANLAQAGLRDLVEIRVGDALQTLQDLPARVDLLFLDGSNDLYLRVLRMIEPRLSPGAPVVADLNKDDPDLLPYLEYVRDLDSGYFSICIPLKDGVELSVRTA